MRRSRTRPTVGRPPAAVVLVLGLAQDDWGPESNTIDQGEVELTIEEPAGETTAQTDRIRFNTVETWTDFSEVTHFLTTDSPQECIGLIRDGVDRYGIDGESAERWIVSAEADPEFRSDSSITPGTSTSVLPTTATPQETVP